MDLINQIDQLHVKIVLNILDERRAKDISNMVSLVESLSLDVLKNLMLDVKSDEFIYKILNDMPIVHLYSKTYNFSIMIKNDSITVDYPSQRSTIPKQKEIQIQEIVPKIDQALVSLYTALKTVNPKLGKKMKNLIGLVFKLKPNTIEELKNKFIVTDIKIPNYSVNMKRIFMEFIPTNEEEYDNAPSYQIVFQDTSYVYEKRFNTDSLINMGDFLPTLIKEAELFIEEKTINEC